MADPPTAPHKPSQSELPHILLPSRVLSELHSREPSEASPPEILMPSYGLYETNSDAKPEKKRKNARRHCQINHSLVGRTPEGICFVPERPARPRILRALHNKNGHFGAETFHLLLRGRVWWPNPYRGVRNYFRACHNCQMRQPFGSEVIQPSASTPISGL